jgi:3-hydroxybutyryl-CoA dehydratase
MNSKPGSQRSFAVGEKAQISKLISDEDVLAFARITGDLNPVHLDDEFARRTRFKGRIAHGMLSAGLISAVLGTKLPGPGSIYLSQELKFLRPVRIGDKLVAEVEVKSWDASKRIVGLITSCYNQDGEKVVAGSASLLVEPPSAEPAG